MNDYTPFNINLACDLLFKTPNQVLDLCRGHNPNKRDIEFIDDDVDWSSSISFSGLFKLDDYEAFGFTSINFKDELSVECIISLGEPSNLQKYYSAEAVFKRFIKSLSIYDINAKVIKENANEYICAWKRNDRCIVNLIYYSPGMLSLQVRDLQEHPWSSKIKKEYNSSKRYTISRSELKVGEITNPHAKKIKVFNIITIISVIILGSFAGIMYARGNINMGYILFAIGIVVSVLRIIVNCKLINKIVNILGISKDILI